MRVELTAVRVSRETLPENVGRLLTPSLVGRKPTEGNLSCGGLVLRSAKHNR
jgi:hypothetical protein